MLTLTECGVAPSWEPGRLDWSQRSVNGAVVVQLTGELDLSTSIELRRRLLGVARTGDASRIVLDLSDVHFIDAHSIGVIVGAREAAAACGRTLHVDGLRALPARMFSLLGLEPIVKRCDDEPGGDPSEERMRRAELWEAGADERERLADDVGEAEVAATRAALQRAEASVLRAEAELRRAREAAERVQAHAALRAGSRASRELADVAQHLGEPESYPRPPTPPDGPMHGEEPA